MSSDTATPRDRRYKKYTPVLANSLYVLFYYSFYLIFCWLHGRYTTATAILSTSAPKIILKKIHGRDT